MKKKLVISLVVVFLLVFVVSCIPSITITETKTPNSSINVVVETVMTNDSIYLTTQTITPENLTHWWTSWIDTPVCNPPCWENITPGVTTQEEALLIIDEIPGVTITFKGKNGADWLFQNNTEFGTLRSSENGFISSVNLGTLYESQLLLESVVAKYGYPTYLQPYDCRDGICSTVLIYPDMGMLLDVFLNDSGINNNHQVEIQSNTKIQGVIFFLPGLNNFKQMLDYQDYDLLWEWKGYGEYPNKK